MVRIVTTLAIALLLGGCGLFGRGEPVDILVATADVFDGATCFLPVVEDRRLLVADPTVGTALRSDDGTTIPATWPPGYTGRRFGSDVMVYDAEGNLRAVTGRYYNVDFGPSDSEMAEVICSVTPM